MEYRKIDDLSFELKMELKDNESFFNDVDGKSLDEQQRIACVLNDCDLEIIAGAGTGKTQTLVAKSSYLVEKKNIKPSEILCLSFSTSSVEDLNERLKYLFETRTIHALGLSIIKSYEDRQVLDEYGFYEIFAEYLEDASPKQLFDIRDYCETYLANPSVKIKLHEIDSEEEKFNFLIKNTSIRFKLQNFIDLFKGKDYGLDDFKKLFKRCEEDLKGSKYYYSNMSFLNVMEPVFRYYQGYLAKNRLIDFNDMVNKAIKIVETKGMPIGYKYIFVDEYQDMSYKNFQLVKAIKDKTGAHLVVVGDDWQSIYGFRDSDLKLFTDFDYYFPDSKRVFIEKTYRNPQQLINAAGNFIMKNDDQFEKSLISDSSCDKPIKLIYHSRGSERRNNTIYNLIYNLSKDNEVLILGRHRKDIDDFLKGTDLVKKGRSKNHKIITDKYGGIENVEFRTIHKAKGLEADYTIIIQVIDDMVGFPNKLYPSYFMKVIHEWDNDDKIEEERRLFYVALTRAKKGVYIFTTESRPSEYIYELKEDSLENIEVICSEDEDTYSHLSEFNKAPKPEKTKKSRKAKVKAPSVDISKVELSNQNIGNSDQIKIKADLKDIGNRLMKSKDYDEAEDFYTKLISNMFYLNDYYPFRKLTEVYRKKKDSGMVIKTIEAFFKSERYCNNSQLLWFKMDYKKACKYTGRNFNEFYNHLVYFNEHGAKNRHKQNDPVPIAARIKTGKYLSVISQEEFDRQAEKKELESKYKFARKYESSEKTLSYLKQLWNQKGFKRNLTAYKRLCSLYYDTEQYDKVIEVANEYFESDARKTKGSPDWFRRKIRNAESKLNRKPSEIPVFEKKTPNSDKNRITVSRKNFTNLLSSNVGDEIIIKKRWESIRLEIMSIDNPRGMYNYLDGRIKMSISNENFDIVRNLGIGGVITIAHKNSPGKIDLKIIDFD